MPACERIAVPIDLRTDWSAPLKQAGLATAQPTAWLAEGLLVYLTAEEAEELLTRIGELSVMGSRLAFEVRHLGTERMRAHAHRMPAMRQYTELWKGGLPDCQRPVQTPRRRPVISPVMASVLPAGGQISPR